MRQKPANTVSDEATVWGSFQPWPNKRPTSTNPFFTHCEGRASSKYVFTLAPDRAVGAEVALAEHARALRQVARYAVKAVSHDGQYVVTIGGVVKAAPEDEIKVHVADSQRAVLHRAEIRRVLARCGRVLSEYEDVLPLELAEIRQQVVMA